MKRRRGRRSLKRGKLKRNNIVILYDSNSMFFLKL